MPSPQPSRRQILAFAAAAAAGWTLSRLGAFAPAQVVPSQPAGQTALWESRMLPIVEPAGWQDDQFYCWGGDALIGPGEEGPETVHFYGTRWPKWSGFLGCLWRAEICRATSTSVTGPFVTREVILDDRTEMHPNGGYFWDHHSVFNPTVLEHDGRIYLYYTGTQHDPAAQYGPDAVPQLQLKMTQIRDGHERMRQRIGVLIGESPTGPWRRLPQPLLDPTDTFHSNPSAVIAPDGRCYLYYKTIHPEHGSLVFSLATAPTPEGPFTPHPHNPILSPGRGVNIEDMCVWIQDGRFFMLFKDMSGRLCGVPNGIAIIDSDDGIAWDPSRARLAFVPGWPTAQGLQRVHRLERPNLLMRDGRPVALYCAALNGDERLDPTHPFHRRLDAQTIASSPSLASRNIAIALKPE